MSKKVNCLDCGECMRFAVPSKRVLEENPDIIDRLKSNVVCGQTNKTKNVDNEQYCTHYFEAAEHRRIFNSKERYSNEIDNKLTSVE